MGQPPTLSNQEDLELLKLQQPPMHGSHMHIWGSPPSCGQSSHAKGFPSLPLAAFCCGLCVQFTGDPNLGVSSYLHCPLPSQTKDFQVEARALTMEAIAFTAQP